jgi:hypothetical protein
MALPVYQLNSIPSVEDFNAFLRPRFTKKANEEEFPGFLRQLTDDQLSDALPNIKPQWQAFRDELIVTAGTGLNVNYTGGRCLLPTGAIVTIGTGSLTLANNATNYVYVDATGVVRGGVILPQFYFLLATVTTVAGAISGLIADSRLRGFEVHPPWNRVRVFGGTSQNDKTSVTGDILNLGQYYYRNWAVPSGVGITVDGFARAYCSGDVTITGLITVTSAIQGGGGRTVWFIGAGGTSAPGFTQYSTAGGAGGGGIGAGGGGAAGSMGRAYNYLLQPYGSGGGSGFVTQGSASFPNGGDGGGGIWIEAAGAITIASSGIIRADGGNAAASDNSANMGLVGAGGGSGGTIVLVSAKSITVSPGALLSVVGGNGGDGRLNGTATTSGFGGNGGGAGGGGQIILIAPIINVTGATLNVSAGVPGAIAPGIQHAAHAPRGGGNGGKGGVGASSAGGVPLLAAESGKITTLFELPI